ncbi:MAG: response regulator, partial [Spirochaetales bacterium]|nr:response regulator [Spirochaetales bacterium]
ALKHILDAKIDLIISDYRMDVLGGDYWMRFLQRFCSDIKVIVTSGFLKGHKNLPFELIEKPFDYVLLAARIKSILYEEHG